MYQYRPLQAKDLPILKVFLYHSLYVREGEMAFPSSILDEPDLKKYYEGWGRANDYGLLAIHKEEAVGAVWARYFSRQNPSYGFVDEATPELGIALLPEHRGKGLGSSLLRALFDLLIAEGVKQVSLSVDRRSPAFRLYQRLGFEVCDDGSPSISMLLKLA